MKSPVRIRKHLLFLMVVCSLLISSCTSRKETIRWGKISYQLVKGKWQSLPDFDSLVPAASGISEQISVDWLKENENFAILFTGTFLLREKDLLDVWLHTDGHSRVLIDGKLVLEMKHRDHHFRTSVSLEKGYHKIRVEYLHKTGPRVFEFNISPSPLVVPYARLDNRHWIYFGWKEDHPRAISLMGGALYPRRPKIPSRDDHSWRYTKKPWHPDASKVILFLISVDDGKPFYPDEKATDRRQNIKWYLAENYMPSPVSEWKHQGVKVKIQHIGDRILNNSVDAVYTQVTLSNESTAPKNVKLLLNGKEVANRSFITNVHPKLNKESRDLISLSASLDTGESVNFEFVSPANGTASVEEILSAGSFIHHYSAVKSELDYLLSTITHPVALPDIRLVNLWKSSIPYMLNATVKTPDDYEQRGSGGNPFGFYQYDRTFTHDIPDMVIQYILEGQWEIAKKIMLGVTYDRLSQGVLENEKYLDAIPKYIIGLAQYLQTSGDTAFFNKQLRKNIKRCAHIIHEFRESQLKNEFIGKGPYGLLPKSSTLDNGHNYLVVDNFSALHGLVSYEYICKTLNDLGEAEWARDEMIQLNRCLNQALKITMKEKNSNWYNACFSFDWNDHLLSGPGNWFGTTLMMSTFPWGAYLKGYDLGGTWKDYFDSSVEKWISQSEAIGNPKGSFGAWWGAKYGAAYNAGMGLQLLYSDKYRTKVIESIEWLLENQTVPYNWGESFHRPKTPGDWTSPATDFETWALGFIRQALLQLCVSVKADGTVIIGRGIPEYWLENGGKISWKNVYINDGKKMDLQILKSKNTIHVSFVGDSPDGNYVINLPELVRNIQGVKIIRGSMIEKDNESGRVIVTSETKEVFIQLKNS